MKKKSVVIFPDSVPAAQVLIPLVPVFEPVVYCQPVENDDSRETLSALCRVMVEQSHCQLQAPAPLGEQRERFLHLVRDIQERRDDYTAQLAHVSLASIPTGSKPRTESKSSILSTLLSGHGIDSAGQEQREKLLWQARLIMKLAEQHDADQQKINADLAHIRERERKLFAGLVQENGSPFSLTGKLSSLVSGTENMQRFRLKAWARLFAFGSSSPAGDRFYVSSDPDAVDRLGEEHERRSGSRPPPFLTIALPARYPDEDRFPEQFHRFRRDEAPIRASLSALLEKPSMVSEEHQGRFQGQGSEWSELLDRYFPAQECGRCNLVLHEFHQVQVRQLFLDSFGHDDAQRTDLAEEDRQDIVIGVLAGQ
jgi:hypothetical protein